MFENVESFCRPASIREALQLLHDGKGSARIVAGCTDFMVEGDPPGESDVRCLIDLTRAGLNYIRRRGSHWAIGATTTMAGIEESAVMRALAGGLLCRAAATCGSVQIRNMATLGGNLANGSPAADLATPLLLLDASVSFADASGRHKIVLPKYLSRSRKVHDSIVVEVNFPEPPHGARCAWSFQKFGRTETDISIVNAAVGLQLGAHGVVRWARIALGAVAPMPMRMTAAEQLLTGRVLDQELLGEVCESVMQAVQPVSDVRATADYRRELSRVLTGRAIEECAACAGCSL